MTRSLRKWACTTVVTALALVGLAALAFGAMIASPLVRPPALASISATARAVARSDMPRLTRFSARDGTVLAYRHYPAKTVSTDRIAILIHGSIGSSSSVHALSKARAERGVETFAPDMRGHGASGTRGDVGYVGQLEDDLEDLVAEIRKTSPNAPKGDGNSSGSLQ